MKKRVLPPRIQEFVDGYKFIKNTIGFSKATVFHLVHRTQPSMYLKMQPSTEYPPLYNELQILKFLKGKLPVPRVIAYAQLDNYEYILLSEITGRPSFQVEKDKRCKAVGIIAKGLKLIHSIDSANCPLSFTVLRNYLI